MTPWAGKQWSRDYPIDVPATPALPDKSSPLPCALIRGALPAPLRRSAGRVEQISRSLTLAHHRCDPELDCLGPELTRLRRPSRFKSPWHRWVALAAAATVTVKATQRRRPGPALGRGGVAGVDGRGEV